MNKSPFSNPLLETKKEYQPDISLKFKHLNNKYKDFNK